MRSFKRNHEQCENRGADGSSSEARTVSPWLRRRLVKNRTKANAISHSVGQRSGHASADPSLDSHPNPNHEDCLTNLSLWDRAYATLEQNQTGLVRKYEELLRKEAQKTDPTSTNEAQDDVDHHANNARQAQLDTIIEKGLRRLEARKSTYTIAGHEFILKEQIAQAADLILWAKDLIGQAVKQSPQASIAWVGACIILPLLTNPVIADEANNDGFAYVTTRMRYYAELETLFRRVSRNPEVTRSLIAEAENSIVDLYWRILDFQIQSVLRFYRSSLGRYIRDVVRAVGWARMVKNIKELEDTVNSNLQQINQLLVRRELEFINTTSEEALQNMRLLLSFSKDQVRVTEEHLGTANKQLAIQGDEVKQKLSDEQKECHQLFRLTNSSKDATYEWYKSRVKDRIDGTCQWFLEHEHFQAWLGQESGPLLVSADPGCGKSVLAKYLIDHGLPRSSTICYFFFKDQDQNTARQALCALFHQLFDKKPFLIKHAMKQLDKDGRGLVNSTESLWAILGNVVRDPQAGSIIVVLDALDECAESEFESLVLNLERQFHKNRSVCGKFMFLLTSRPYDRISSKFRRLQKAFPYIRIPGEEESETISQEVNHVIKSRVNELAKEKQLSDKIKNHLEERLLEIQHRTYLWVYLVFDYLKNDVFKKTVKGIDTAIEKLPKDVNEAYERILSKSKEESMVRKALSIILVASRPLTICEMNVALSIDDTSKSMDDLDLEEEKNFELRLRDCCGLFVSIYHGKIYFLHQTAREFLSSELLSLASVPSGVRWQHSITKRNAHKVLAEICVVYLGFLNSEYNIPTGERRKTDKSSRNDDLLDYAAKYWASHFLEARFNDDEDMVAFALEISEPGSRSYSTWVKVYQKIKYWGTEFLTTLVVSSYFGHEAIARRLLEKGTANIESEDTQFGQTPLSWAARNGHEAVVRLLLEKGANLYTKAKNGQTPLYFATENGHEAIVKLLLDKNAGYEENENGWFSLVVAARRGYAAIVKLLLDKGADPEFKDGDGRTSMTWAASTRNEAVAKLLLEKGANPDPDGDGWLLSQAAESGHKAFVRLLLEKGADPNIDDGFGQTPLLSAAQNGHEAVVRLLFEKGASFETNENHWYSLVLAAKNGHETVVRLLLEKGADPNVKYRGIPTPLSSAARNGHETVVKLLLEQGADPDRKDVYGRTPLSLAVKNGHEAVVKLLQSAR